MTTFSGIIIPDNFLPKSQSVVCQLYVIRLDDPEMEISQGGIWEAAEINSFGTTEIIT